MSIQSFSDFDLHPALLRGVQDMGFNEPTHIQRLGIPPALEGRDVLACAMTGSGKTVAFLLPILQRLLERRREEPKRRATRALVLTPTRELAAQILEQFQAVARYTKLQGAAVYGGVGHKPQEHAFRSGFDLIVACPGRLLDHFQQGTARLDALEVLALDEVDRMLDMGFLPDVRRVLRQIPEVDQALFYSATLAKPIAQLARELLDDPATLQIERQATPATGVTQTLWPVRSETKRLLLHELITRGEIDQALVFTRTKHRANRLAQFLSKRRVSADRIHGNRSQAQRTKALADFKSGRTRVLVATDIAARGIDIAELPHVVNFDVPNVTDDYIHRIGRTARAEATGDAFTFVAPEEERDVRAIERVVGRRLERRTLDAFDYGAVPDEKLEIPVRERLAKARAQRRGTAAGPAARGASGRRPDQRARRDERPGIDRHRTERPGRRDERSSTAEPRTARGGRGHGGRPARPGDERPRRNHSAQAADGRSRDGRHQEARPANGRRTEGRSQDAWRDENRRGDTRRGAAGPGDPRRRAGRNGGPRSGEFRDRDARGGDARPGNARRGEARHGEARRGEARRGEARRGDVRHGHARRSDARHGDARHGDTRNGDARHGNARHHDARRRSDLPGAARSAQPSGPARGGRPGAGRPSPGRPGAGRPGAGRPGAGRSAQAGGPGRAGRPGGTRSSKGGGRPGRRRDNF
ncbi:MAG: DEAD/DEAH box helicase [Acidobacteriota bacterium]